MKVLRDLEVSNKRVFVRADLDVPVTDLKGIENHPKLLSLKPTFDFLLTNGAKRIVIAGHIGRPKEPDPELSTEKLLPILEKILGQKIGFIKNFAGPVSSFPPASAHSDLKSHGDKGNWAELRAVGSPSRTAARKIFLLENLRFWPGEVKNDQKFAEQLASLADVYVNEAFSVCHRNNASIVSLAQLLPHAAGLHLQEEVDKLTKLIKNPERPFVAIVGGAKIETKLPVIENLARIADWVLVGGKIAQEVKKSKIKNAKAYFPKEKQKYNSKIRISQANEACKDINQESVDNFKQIISTAKTIVWNGPMGVFEEGFEKGTSEIAQAIIQSGAHSVVGGGETVEFLDKNNQVSKFSFVSSGGGAMLEFLSGKELPGLKALE